MQMQSLRRELSGGLVPLHETFISLIRLFGSKGHATSGLEILAAMERLDYDIRKAWLVLVGKWVSFAFLSRYIYLLSISVRANIFNNLIWHLP